MTWAQVLTIHRTLRGIGTDSLLLDRGESGYANRVLPDGLIEYPCEGLRGHQQPTPGNLRLLEACQTHKAFRVFARQAPNCWEDLGCYQVRSYSYQPDDSGRYVYRFILQPQEKSLKAFEGL